MERLGIELLQKIVVADSEGIAARLDEAIQAAVDSYVDPWLEAETPKTTNQFVSTLQMVAS